MADGKLTKRLRPDVGVTGFTEIEDVVATILRGASKPRKKGGRP